MLPVFLAEITDKDQPALLWYILGGAVAFIAVINYVLSSAVSWQQLRTSDKKHEYASRAELQVIHTRVDQVTPTPSCMKAAWSACCGRKTKPPGSTRSTSSRRRFLGLLVCRT